MVEMLRYATRGAGGFSGVKSDFGGKTGTTDNSFDSWFVGFSPDLVAGVYIGFDTPKSLGEDETGASVALPVFINFMKEALKGVPSMPFRVPSTVKMVNIDRITGKLPSISTPKENFFSEAFKLKDDLDLLEKANEETISSYTPASESNAQASEGVEGAKPSGEGGAEIIKSPAGIY